jgi:hypothetical protein
MSLERFIKFIKEGEPVAPGTPNRPIQQLDQNIKYLYDLIQAAEIGSTVYAREQTVVSTLQEGQPVYFNVANQQFEAAYAAMETDSATGYLTVPEQAQVWGVIAEKHHATLADILLFGFAEVDITAAINPSELNPDGSVPAGLYYLSGASAGYLTKQQPPVSVPVLKADTSGKVYVNPSFVDFLENHRHYVFELEMEPAGDVTPPSVGGVHTITSANSDLPGWLPASDAIFGGLAPTGAKFGYNLSQNPDLNNVFPPIPLQSVAVTMQRPSVWDTTNERRHHAEELVNDLVVVDRNGIWWMSDCYDEVPWPTDLDSSSSVSESYGDCDPAGKEYVLKLYYTRVNFATDNSVVSSIISKDDRLVITCRDTVDPASTGDIDIDLDLSFMIGDQNVSGYTVFKDFDAATGEFSLGPVAEGVYATSSNVQLTSPSQTTDGSGNTVYHGPIGLGVLSQVSQELSSQLVRLDGVTEEDYPVLYLGMPNDDPTSYVVKFEVPADAPSSSTFTFRARILGRIAGTLPPITVEYYKTERPSGTTPVNVIQSYVATTGFDPTAATLTGINQAVEIEADSFSVDPGDIVYVRVQRDPTDAADSYAGELGVMQQTGIVAST